MISSDRRDLFIALAPTDNRSSFEQELLEFVTYRDSGPVVSDLKWGANIRHAVISNFIRSMKIPRYFNLVIYLMY